ncbi:hypothetical protein ACIOD2_47110 [Amycolatopsis sp. NPDC088138]|uniref:hypothetical protein n=1 Tax=Amycolatopsis sp. NPDC088138 TaxID=3363938 RepID=UPI00380D21E7
MRKVIGTTTAAIIGAAAICLTLPGSAAAAGETFGCHVTPNADTGYHAYCVPDRPAARFTVSFKFTGTGTYTYVWNLSGDIGGRTTTAGTCIATSSLCNFSFSSSGDRDIVGQVTATQNGVSITMTATASTPAVCGTYWC